MFNITENNNQLIYTYPVLQLQNQLGGTNNNASEAIIIQPGSYELSDIANIIKNKLMEML